MKQLRLDASIRTTGSVTRSIADTAESSWLAEHPSSTVTRRDIGASPLPSTAWVTAVGAGHTRQDQRTPEQVGAVQLAATLGDELVDADAYLFGVPLYNFGVPAHFKMWVDLLLTDPRLPSGGPSPVAGRPAVLVLARCGGYGAGTPRGGWDHASPYIRRILADVLGLDLHLAEAELTLAPMIAAMEPLRPLAEVSPAKAHSLAAEHGHVVARLLGGRAA
jgi:FMN-dependent NADH-azoreductase